MEVLSLATLMFRDASLGWANAMAPFMESFLFTLMRLGFAVIAVCFLFRFDAGFLFGATIRFLLGIGFALFMVRNGWEFVDSWFSGIKTLGYFLGSPPLDPSAVAAYGPVVADPILKSLANTGFFDFMTSPAAWVGLAAELSLILAFYILAFILMSLLLMSYFLDAACPYFFAWWGFVGTRGVTFGYIRLVLGTMSGLFGVMLMVAMVSELAELLLIHFRDRFVTPGYLPTFEDYCIPLAVGVILCGLFVWIPMKWAAYMGAMVPGWGSGMMLGGYGAAAVGGVGGMMGGGGQSYGGGSSNGGPRSLPAPQQGMPQGGQVQGQGMAYPGLHSGGGGSWGHSRP